MLYLWSYSSIKTTVTDNAEIENPTVDPSYNVEENQAYQYFGQPDATNQPIRKPRPFRRQSIDLSGALEPVTSILGPDAAVRFICLDNLPVQRVLFGFISLDLKLSKHFYLTDNHVHCYPGFIDHKRNWSSSGIILTAKYLRHGK